MVNLTQFASAALLLLPLVTAQAPVAELFDDMYYEGARITIPADGNCYDLKNLTPDLTRKVSSMKVPDGYYCAINEYKQCSGVGVLKLRASTNSLYNQGWNDKIMSVMCLKGRKKSKGGRR
ncbi:hypothetical protein BDW42DRAFT_175728 [Aspergillus taichungensis]|uniref:Beta/gamma crystallin 'Greek key' domain-containing protein n=1 Tax=Aspergillus taichungensis TaxID=482145 RepID=A0A2J5HLP2_9EURO|nr:hypothetical protein BDW42DRAFT_175728 [Aspergillus taichungensis]